MSEDAKFPWSTLTRVYYLLATPIYVATYSDFVAGVVEARLDATGMTAVVSWKYFLRLGLGAIAVAVALASYIRYRRTAQLAAAEKEINQDLGTPVEAKSSPTTIAAPAGPNTLERVMDRKVIRVGCIVARPWFIFADNSKSPSGIYPTILNDIAERNGLSVIYTPIRNNVVLEQLESREVDMVAQLLQTDERARRAQFAAYIHNVAMIAVTRKSLTSIKQPADLRNRAIRCAVVKGEIGSEIAPRLYDMTEENDRLVVLNTYDVPSVFYLIHGDVAVAITTAARWRELQVRDPQIAQNLKPAFQDPLLLIPAGTLIKRGETPFGVWLEKETAISRALPAIRDQEDSLLAEFGSAIVRI